TNVKDRAKRAVGKLEGPDLNGNPAKGGNAVGIAAGIHLLTQSARAEIMSGARVYADSLHVNAENEVVNVTLGISGGKADNVGLNGVGLVTLLDNTTHAIIHDGATIRVGNTPQDGTPGGDSLVVNAHDASWVIGAAGSGNQTGHVGIGASVAFNQSERDTLARIGADLTELTPQAVDVVSGAGVRVEAQHTGLVGGVAIAAAIVTDKSKPDGETTGLTDKSGSSTSDTSRLGDSSGGPSLSDKDLGQKLTELYGITTKSSSSESSAAPSGKAGIGISGSVAINIGRHDVRAEVIGNGLGQLVAGGSGLTVKAADLSVMVALTGSVAWSSPQPGQTSVGIAGAASVNTLDGEIAARVERLGTLTAPNILLDADRNAILVALAAGFGGAKGQKGVGLAGSVAVQLNSQDTRASLAGIGTATATGDVTVRADNLGVNVSIAGAVAYGGKVGVGLAVAYSSLSGETRAEVTDVASLTVGDAMLVEATSRAVFVAVSGAAGVGTGGGGGQGFGVAGTLTLNQVDSDTIALVTRTTMNTPAGGDITIRADDSAIIVALAGSFGVGAKAGIGLAFALSFVANTVRAASEGSTLRTARRVAITAEASAVLVTIGASGAGAEKAGIAGGITVNQTRTNTIAEAIGVLSGGVPVRSQIFAGGAVEIQATDATTFVSLAGGLAFAQNAAVGAALGVNLLGNTITARVQGSDVTAGTTLDVRASANSLLVGIGIAGAGAADKFALAASISVNQVENTIEALVEGGSSTTSTGSTRIAATDRTRLVAASGGIAGTGGSLGIGAAAATAQLDNTIRARVDGSAVTTTGVGSDIEVTAGIAAPVDARSLSALLGANTSDDLDGALDATSQVIVIALAVGASKEIGLGAALGLGWMRNSIVAEARNGATLTAADAVLITAPASARSARGWTARRSRPAAASPCAPRRRACW
nr:hypothetical protein [Gemmatimonadaceae bacterium]